MAGTARLSNKLYSTPSGSATFKNEAESPTKKKKANPQIQLVNQVAVYTLCSVMKLSETPNLIFKLASQLAQIKK